MKSGLTKSRLIMKGLRHHWRINLAVILASAVGVAVLTGSFLIGGSMRRSLRDLVLGRLGGIEHVLVSDLYFRQELAAAIPGTAPVIVQRGSALHAESGARASHVQVLGVDDSFGRFAAADDERWDGLSEWDAIVSDALARELQVKVDEEIIVRVQKPSAIPRETLLGERDSTVATLRLRVARIAPSAGLGGFGLSPTQRQPLNVFVPLASLQQRLEQPERVNAIFAGKSEGDPQEALARHATPEDAGLELREANGELLVESARIFLRDEDVELAQTALAAHANTSPVLTLSYLVNLARAGERAAPYSMAVGVNAGGPPSGEVDVNEWLANDLKVKTGDRVELTYFDPETGESWDELTTALTVRRVTPIAQWPYDKSYVPEMPGISEAENIGGGGSKWDTPFPLRHDVRQLDEDYWDAHKAAPKLAVSLETARRLWRNRYGRLTGLRWKGLTKDEASKLLQAKFDPAAAGLVFQAVKERGLTASKGASDFGGLFIGFSLFLLISAALLIQILFRLGVEARAREFGLLRAVGLRPKRVRGLMVTEGAVIGTAGAALGALLGVGYAAVLTYGLNHWWVRSIGAPFLQLSVAPGELWGGFVGGFHVALFSMIAACFALSRVPESVLLAGRIREERETARRRRWAGLAAVALGVAGLGLLAASGQVAAHSRAALFFGGGGLLLAAALAGFASWLGRPAASSRLRTLAGLGLSAARRRRGRSFMVAALMALATFLIVAVGAHRRVAEDTREKASGTGGFALFAESALPLYHAIDEEVLNGAVAYPLRLKPGDNAGCLNLYKTSDPRIVGVTDEFVARGGFVFASSLAESEAAKRNPWTLLNEPLADGAIPVIGDFNSVMWLLHLGLGKDLDVDGARLRFVGLLKGSVLQGELLMSAENFDRLYPAYSGWRFFAIESDRDAVTSVTAALETELEDFGFDAEGAAEKLQGLMEVENGYLATFQSLGGLGFLLGTLGLALALLRNLLERRREFALLEAMGFRFSARLWLAVSENLLLLLVGMLAGTGCALIAITPGLALHGAHFPWASLTLTLLGILAFAVAATVGCAALALRTPALQALRKE